MPKGGQISEGSIFQRIRVPALKAVLLGKESRLLSGKHRVQDRVLEVKCLISTGKQDFIGDTELYQSQEVNKGGVLSRLGVGRNFVNFVL